MINDIPKWWSLLTYDGLKYHVNVTEGLENFAEDRIRVGKEEAGTSNFNQAYDKLQANQEKAQTRQILDLAQRNIHDPVIKRHVAMRMKVNSNKGICPDFSRNVLDGFRYDHDELPLGYPPMNLLPFQIQ